MTTALTVGMIWTGVAVLGAVAQVAMAQQPYPNRVIRIVAPFPPGGTTDILSRLIGQKLSERWGQQVIVDNRPGGNTIIGTEIVAKSKPDGYTVLVAGSTHVIMPLLTSAPFDPIKDFSPIGTLSASPQVLAVHPSLPVKTVRDLVTLARARPGQLNYASYGNGSGSHLGAEFFSILGQVKMQHIPYKGAGPAVSDLLGGQVQVFFGPPAPIAPHAKTGRLRALAVSTDYRVQVLPDVPTFTEMGMPNFDVKTWLGMFAPAGTPTQIVEKFSSDIMEILRLPETMQALGSQGIEPFASTSEQFAALLRSDMAKYDKVIKAAKIKLD